MISCLRPAFSVGVESVCNQNQCNRHCVQKTEQKTNHKEEKLLFRTQHLFMSCNFTVSFCSLSGTTA
jgi:hypothetical protein